MKEYKRTTPVMNAGNLDITSPQVNPASSNFYNMMGQKNPAPIPQSVQTPVLETPRAMPMMSATLEPAVNLEKNS